MGIRVYNTLTRRKEDLAPRDEGRISMYVCGPTVYNYIHVGNARTFLNFDMIRRYLDYSGFEVTCVQNITDVDDKIINKSKEEGTGADEVAEKYRLAFERDMAALGVKPPDVEPWATEHIPDMIEVIEALIEKGYAYRSEGDVYFEVAKFPDYGKLSGRNLEEQQVTSQCDEESRRKREPNDFTLWKAAKPGEPSWESPWGKGRPGWHIECSTMSVKYLGAGFDIHGGGQDLVFPHHENEIAQSEAYSGSRFARYWLHSGMLNIDREKMSKSLGNIKQLREVLEEYDPDTIRMLMLGTHYHSPLSFSDESLDEARASLARIKNCMFNLDDVLGRIAGEKASLLRTEQETRLMGYFEDAQREFREAMDDDFNSAAALGVIFGLVKEINTYVDEIAALATPTPVAKLVLLEAQRLLEDLCGALGLFQKGVGRAIVPTGGVTTRVKTMNSSSRIKIPEDEGPTREQLVELLLTVRRSARENKNFELADAIRRGLSDLGVRVEDVRDGFRWRLER